MTDHMQLQRQTIGQSADTLTSVISSAPVSTPTATPQLAPEPPAQTESALEQAPELSQEPQPSYLGHDFGRLSIFAKLSVSQPNDPYEQEADRMAEQVMRMPDRTHDSSPSVQAFAGHDFGQIALSPKLQPIAQRKCAACEKEEKLMRKESGDSIGDVSRLESKLAESQSGGEPLSYDIRAFMEPRFGFDFSQVRVHTDSSAVEMSQSIDAQAFTHGNNIYFNAGKYAPETQNGKQLLAHELTHTVQQTGGILGHANHSQPGESIPDNELIQAKMISKAPSFLISLKAIPSVGDSTPPPAPQLDTSSSEGLLQSLSNTPASSLSQAVHQAKGTTGQIQIQEKQKLETNLPEQESSTGLPRRSSRPQAKATTLEPGEAPKLKMAKERTKKEFEVKHKAAEGAVPGSNVSTEASAPNNPGGWFGWLTGRISSFLKDIPTKDSGLNTSAGGRPTVDLDGEADPNQNDQYQRESDQEVKARQRQADQAAAENFGENDIYPTVPTQRLRSSHQLTSPHNLAGRGQNPPHLPDDIRASFDENETPKLSPKLQYQLRQYQAKEAKHQRESQQIRQEGQNRIDQETGRVRDQQIGLQQQAQGDVNAERQRWREENQSIQEEYNNQAQTKRRDLDQQIQGQVETTERETDRKLTEAEQRAESEQRRTEREAEDKKRDFENKPQNFWERAKDAISSLFEGLRQGIERLFEGLRQLVQQIIEAAKTVVRALIEAARQVIVALIRGFGEVLKGLVTVALFAFPETAARAREWIDGRVNTAIERVNEAAEQLTRFTDAALDWIGQRLDDALNLLQGAFNVALDVAEFLATAPLEIMNQLAQIMDWLQKNGGLIGGIERLEQSAAQVKAGAKETLQGYIDQIPGEMQQQLDAASQQVDLEAIRPHWDGIWQYIQQDFEDLKTGWWDAIKDMLWTWIWPFHENSPVRQDWPKFTEELENCFNHIKAGKYSEAIDSFLTASQLLTGIIDAFSMWFTIAAVIIGAVIGSIVPGPGTMAGAKAGLEVAGVLGTVLSVFSFAVEAGILGKAIYDVSTGENTEAENDEDYQAIASSGVAVTTEIVFAGIGFLIGAAAGSTIGTKIGHSIASAIVRMLRKIPYKPRTGRADLPDVEPDLGAPGGDRTDGADTDGTDSDGSTPETEGQTDSNGSGDGSRNTPETQDGTDAPQTTEPSEPDTDPAQTPDQPRDQSTGDGSETATPDTTPNHPGDSPQSQSPDTRPADQPSNGRLTDEQLTEGLPPDLQGQVPVRVNPELSGNTVRVYYTRNGDGTVGDIHIEAGPDARRVDIELHAETVRLMQRYSGLSGRIRILKERIQNWISRNGEPPIGSRAWEAKLEIDKLPRVIDERLERLSRGDLDAEAEADLRADIENLEQQLDQHQQTLNEMDTDPGVGFVAANDRADALNRNGTDTPSAEDSPGSREPSRTFREEQEIPNGRTDTSSSRDQEGGTPDRSPESEDSETPDSSSADGDNSGAAETRARKAENFESIRRLIGEKPPDKAPDGYYYQRDQSSSQEPKPIIQINRKKPANDKTHAALTIVTIDGESKVAFATGDRPIPDKYAEAEAIDNKGAELTGNTTIGVAGRGGDPSSQMSVDEALNARREALDEYNRRRQAGDSDAGHSLAEANRHTEALGEAAAEAYMRQAHPSTTQAYRGHGPNTFDQVWRIDEPPSDFFIVEAKGGSATNTSSREFMLDGKRYQQGTPEYMDSLIDVMRTSSDKDIRELGDELYYASLNDGIRYLEVSQKLTETGLGDIQVREYDIS
jgi:hypothetical protein